MIKGWEGFGGLERVGGRLGRAKKGWGGLERVRVGWGWLGRAGEG